MIPLRRSLSQALIASCSLAAACADVDPAELAQQSRELRWPGADLIVRGGPILTGDVRSPRVEAMAVRRGVIVATGTAAEIQRHLTPDTEILELGGAAALPGLVDSHAHIGMTWPALRIAQPFADHATILARLAEAVHEQEELPLVFYGWVPFASLGTREELDAISSSRPIIVQAIDVAHGIWLNSAAIALAGFEEPVTTPPFPGAPIAADGRYGGVFFDSRWWAQLNRRMVDALPEAEFRASVLAELEAASATGITAIHNMSQHPRVIRFLRDLADRGELGVRVREAYFSSDEESAGLARAGELDSAEPDWFRIFGIKYVLDGGPFSGTAAYSPDFPFRREPTMTSDELAVAIDEASRRREQVLVHAIGHEATHVALDALEAAAGRPDRLRFRIEHAEAWLPGDFERIAALEPIISIQPGHFPLESLAGILPPAEEYQVGSHLQQGTTLILNADLSVPPLTWLALAVMGPTPAEALSFDQALAASTASAAFAARDERTVGVLERGRWADFTVVSADPTPLPPSALFGVQVLRTVVAGRTTFAAP
jgi:predicted amidohydrolase YtcJ